MRLRAGPGRDPYEKGAMDYLRDPLHLRGGNVAEREVTAVPGEGLHARPAAEFVKEAKGYNSDTKVIKDGKEANAESSLNLMSLGAKKAMS